MKQVNGDEFLELLYSNALGKKPCEVIIHKTLNIDLEKVNSEMIFLNNITFSGKKFNFTNKKKDCIKTFNFSGCTFNGDISFEGTIHDIQFMSNTFDCDIFEIKNSEIGTLVFNTSYGSDSPKNTFKKGNLIVNNCNFSSPSYLAEVQFAPNSTFEINKCTFKNSISIDHLSFQEKLDLKIYNSTFKNKCTFNINFNAKDNKLNFRIDGCHFLESTYFENFHNALNSTLYIANSNFMKYVDFEQFRINNLTIEKTIFSDNISFQKSVYNAIKLDKVAFEKYAWFNDIKIENYDRSTISTIKQHLINTHNQIDYLRFKSFELIAYDKEKGKDCKDRIILFFNKHSNYFGLDWTRGLGFIGYTGFAFYLLFLITYAIAMKNTIYFPKTVEDFCVGYLKFLNPISLSQSPIKDAEEHIFPLLSFLIGRIFISYGIYQTIQAFRKFGVNGG